MENDKVLSQECFTNQKIPEVFAFTRKISDCSFMGNS